MKEIRRCLKCRHYYFREDCKHKFDQGTGFKLETCPKCNHEIYERIFTPTDTTRMKAKVSKNYDIKEEKDVFGVVIQMLPRRNFCKYIYGYQSFSTKDDAQKEVDKINKQLQEESIEVDFGKSMFLGINKAQYIKLNDK